MDSERSSLERRIGADDAVFFMHVPKTAGTTLVQILEQNFDEAVIARWLYPTTVIEAGPALVRDHRYFQGHVEHGMMACLPDPPRLTVTMLREPVERALSQYGNHRRATPDLVPDVPADQLEQLQRIDLRRLLFDPPPRVAPLAANFHDLQAKFLATEHDPARLRALLPCLGEGTYIYPAPDVARAERTLDTFAFVGLVERFQESLFLLAYTFGWLPMAGYRSLNVGADRPRQHALAPDLLDRLVELNRADREVYDHGRRLFDARYEQMIHELLDRHGRAAHARLRPPWPADVVAEMLERHYARRFVERHPAVPGITLSFDAAISGRGWERRERDADHGVFRWTGPGPRSSLDLPITAHADARLRVSVAMQITPEVLGSLEVTVNDQVVAMRREASETGTLLEGPVPRAVLARRPGCARIGLEVAHTVMPSTVIPGSRDDRPLGIAVNRVEIESVTEPAQDAAAGTDDMTRLRIERVLAPKPLDR